MVKYVQVAFCKWGTRNDWQTRRGNIKHWSASPRGRLDETVKFQGDAIDAWQTCKCYRRSSRSGQECANALRNCQPHGRLLTCFQQCVPMKQMICRLTELSTNHPRGVIIHASQIKTAVKVRCATKKSWCCSCRLGKARWVTNTHTQNDHWILLDVLRSPVSGANPLDEIEVGNDKKIASSESPAMKENCESCNKSA